MHWLSATHRFYYAPYIKHHLLLSVFPANYFRRDKAPGATVHPFLSLQNNGNWGKFMLLWLHHMKFAGHSGRVHGNIMKSSMPEQNLDP